MACAHGNLGAPCVPRRPGQCANQDFIDLLQLGSRVSITAMRAYQALKTTASNSGDIRLSEAAPRVDRHASAARSVMEGGKRSRRLSVERRQCARQRRAHASAA